MNDLSNNLKETANCYIISEQGNYEFPLVYGCGFMNGKENPRSYAGDNFLDYKGEIINTPEINYKIKDVKIISWDSDPDIIKNITIKENYIKFSITKIPEGGANYIIAIFDDQDTIIWSWHLWLWSDDLKDVRIGNYTFLNIPLASRLEDEKLNIGYYQWGRKDPILDNISKIEKRSSNTMEAIQNPDVLYYNAGSTWSWIDSSNYWGKEKTIYDPCPAGYKVPGKESLVNIIKCESYKKDSIKGGIQFNDMFIPLSGIKYSDGIFYKDIRGVFWCNEVEERQCGSALALHLQKCNVITSYMKTEAVGIIPQKYDD